MSMRCLMDAHATFLTLVARPALRSDVLDLPAGVDSQQRMDTMEIRQTMAAQVWVQAGSSSLSDAHCHGRCGRG